MSSFCFNDSLPWSWHGLHKLVQTRLTHVNQCQCSTKLLVLSHAGIISLIRVCTNFRLLLAISLLRSQQQSFLRTTTDGWFAVQTDMKSAKLVYFCLSVSFCYRLTVSLSCKLPSALYGGLLQGSYSKHTLQLVRWVSLMAANDIITGEINSSQYTVNWLLKTILSIKKYYKMLKFRQQSWGKNSKLISR